MGRTRPSLAPHTIVRTLRVGALVLVIAGCATPIAEETQAPPDTTTPSLGAVGSIATPSSGTSTPASTATPMPTKTPALTLAFEAPDGILPPSSLARVVVDALNIRYPTLDGP